MRPKVDARPVARTLIALLRDHADPALLWTVDTRYRHVVVVANGHGDDAIALAECLAGELRAQEMLAAAARTVIVTALDRYDDVLLEQPLLTVIVRVVGSVGAVPAGVRADVVHALGGDRFGVDVGGLRRVGSLALGA